MVQTINGLPHTHGATFSQDGHRAFITSETANILYEVDTKTGTILRQAQLRQGTANLPALTPDQKQIFVCMNGPRDAKGNMQSQLPGSVNVVDVASFEVTKVLPMKGGMHDCYTTPDGKYVLASSLGGKFLTMIDPKTYKSAWSIDFDRGVTTSAFEINPDGSINRIFSPLTAMHGFSVIDYAAHKEISRVTLPDPSDYKMSGKLERRNDQPTHGNAISPDGKTLWIVSRVSNGVFVYSLPDLKFVKYIPTEKPKGVEHPFDTGDPGWITFTSDGKKAYIACAVINAVSVIDTKTMEQIAVVPVGDQPDHVERVVIQ